jgi:hypothetical protein
MKRFWYIIGGIAVAQYILFPASYFLILKPFEANHDRYWNFKIFTAVYYFTYPHQVVCNLIPPYGGYLEWQMKIVGMK